MPKNITRLFQTAVALLTLSAAAVAGPLPVDPNAIPGWQGSANFLGVNGAFTLSAAVEFAVYAPGQFPTSALLGNPGAIDPSLGTEYVYAYEVFNQGNAVMISLSVGIQPGGIPNGSTNVTHDPVSPELGLAPDISQFIPAGDPKTSAKWSYTTSLLLPGLHSDILLFTSPFGPHMNLSSMVGGHATLASSALPSPLPVPEPATLALSLVAATCLVATQLIRRRRA